jgi:hypothetical protein
MSIQLGRPVEEIALTGRIVAHLHAHTMVKFEMTKR